MKQQKFNMSLQIQYSKRVNIIIIIIIIIIIKHFHSLISIHTYAKQKGRNDLMQKKVRMPHLL